MKEKVIFDRVMSLRAAFLQAKREGGTMPAHVKPMAIKLPQEDKERLQKLGAAKKRSAHWLAKEAISQFLDREEAAEQFRQETVTRWEEYCHTGKSVPHDAVMKWLESWGTENELEAPKCE